MADTDILKLTDAKVNQASFVLYTTPVDATKGLSITFDLFSYGGSGGSSGSASGGDGIGFFLIDGTQSPTKPGGFGGSLGYAQRIGGTGLAGGYLGVGFDEFGNYSAAQEGRIGGPGSTPDAVAVRGSEATSYKYLTGTALPVSLDIPGAQATRVSSRKHAQIDLTPAGLLTVQIDLNNDGDFLDAGEKPITAFNVVGVGGNGALPATLKFGFAASTGAATNIHEVGNFNVTTSDGTPLSGSFSGGGLLITGSDTGTTGVLTGSTGGDTIVAGGGGGSTLTGKAGGDKFTFAGTSKAAALKSSTVSNLTKITDFNYAEGDRFQLDFDNNLNTPQLPKGLFYAGKISARNLTDAAKLAYADKNPNKRGSQPLKADEALFFKFGSRTYLSVNDGKAAFATKFDLVADVTGIQFKSNDTKKAALSINDYFV